MNVKIIIRVNIFGAYPNNIAAFSHLCDILCIFSVIVKEEESSCINSHSGSEKGLKLII